VGQDRLGAEASIERLNPGSLSARPWNTTKAAGSRSRDRAESIHTLVFGSPEPLLEDFEARFFPDPGAGCRYLWCMPTPRSPDLADLAEKGAIRQMATPVVQRGRAASHRFGVQMVAGMLALSVPMMVVIAAVLATQATHSLTTASERHGQSVARAVTVHVEDWVSERKENIAVIAARASGRLNDPAVAALAAEIDKAYSEFTLIELTDMTGTVVATSRPGTVVKPAGQDWFATAASGQPVLTSLTEHDGRLQWIVAQPVLGIDGRPAGVAVGYLDVTVLAGLLNPELDHSTDVVAVDAQHRLVYDTALGKVDSEALLKAGVLRTRLTTPLLDSRLPVGSVRPTSPICTATPSSVASTRSTACTGRSWPRTPRAPCWRR
jgi:hypothetical protein